MKRLERIILVNWYLIDALEIAIEGHTAVIGPNASGKSSLLDAVQTVLLGGHGHYLSLNPSAGEKSKRSLRDYCLGVVRDPSNPDLSPDMRPRDNAITYLVLGFRDTETDERTSVGLALQASLDQAKHQIDGRFIAPNCAVDLHDFVEHDGGGRRPKPWKAVRDSLGTRCAAFRHYPRPEAYVQALGAVLSHNGSRHIEPTRFLRNFQNAITFAPIGNVSDFVRRYILDDKPIEIDQLRRSLQSYREIKQKIDEVSQRIDALKLIDKRYREAEQAAARSSQYDWVAAELRLQALDAELEPLHEERDQLASELTGIAKRQATLETERESLRGEITRLQVALQSSDHGQRKQQLESQREAAELRLQQNQSALEAARSQLSRLFPLQASEIELPEALRESVAAACGLLGADEALLAEVWPVEPQALEAALTTLAPQLGEARESLQQQYEQAIGELQSLKTDLEERRASIERLDSGEADLGRGTLALMERLASNGIEAQPLCDLIDVSDADWRACIESYLGGQREALVVAPEDAREAVRLYRIAGRGERLQGARVINSTQTEAWLDRCDADSLAELIETDNPHARAFANRLLGRVQRVETEAELLNSERAATRDGMLHANGSVSHMRDEEPKLGRGSRAAQLDVRRAHFAERSAEFATLEQRKRALETLLQETLTPLTDWLQRPLALLEQSAQRADQQVALREFDAQIEALSASDDSQLQAQLAEIEAGDQQKLDEQRELRQREDQRRARRAQLDAAEQSLQSEIERSGQARSAAANAPGMNLQAASELLAELEEKTGDGEAAAALRKLAQDASQRRDRQRRSADNRRSEAYGKAVEYQAQLAPLSEQSLQPDNHPRTAALVAEQLRVLEDTELAGYSERAGSALREAELTFRADFVGRLQENLAQLQEKIAEINRQLRSRPFHGEVYSFTRAPAPDYAGLIDWVESWSPEAGEDVGGLFDDSGAANHPHRKAIAQVQRLLMEAAESGNSVDTALADYRNYYVYDVKMSEVGTEGERNTTYLSKRLGRGSGGEHQSPFYVAIGAALAATYRIVKKPDGSLEGGMSLAVFDEAFSKLDVANTQSALAFLDELGLQVLLAAPDEKYGLMSEQMDTIVNVYRSGGAISIDCEQIKPAARALLAADNPLQIKAAET